MRRKPDRIFRSGGAFVAAALIVSLSGACSAAVDRAEPVSSCAMPPAIGSPPSLPADFPQPPGVVLTEFQAKKEFVATEGYDDRSVEELFEATRPVVVGKGFDIVNSDYEGFEAELYFAKGDDLAGIVALREAVCDGYVKVNVTYDPLETEAARKAIRKTRRLSGEG